MTYAACRDSITGRPLLVRHALRNALIPDHYGTGAAGCRSDDWFPGYREDLLDSRHRKFNDCSDSVQRLQRRFRWHLSTACHVHCPDAGGCVLYGIIDPRIRLAKKSDEVMA